MNHCDRPTETHTPIKTFAAIFASITTKIINRTPLLRISGRERQIFYSLAEQVMLAGVS